MRRIIVIVGIVVVGLGSGVFVLNRLEVFGPNGSTVARASAVPVRGDDLDLPEVVCRPTEAAGQVAEAIAKREAGDSRL